MCLIVVHNLAKQPTRRHAVCSKKNSVELDLARHRQGKIARKAALPSFPKHLRNFLRRLSLQLLAQLLSLFTRRSEKNWYSTYLPAWAIDASSDTKSFSCSKTGNFNCQAAASASRAQTAIVGFTGHFLAALTNLCMPSEFCAARTMGQTFPTKAQHATRPKQFRSSHSTDTSARKCLSKSCSRSELCDCSMFSRTVAFTSSVFG